MRTMRHSAGRRLLPLIATLTMALAMSAGVAASTLGSLPGLSLGGDQGLTAGPLGLNPKPAQGEIPVAIRIPDASVDADVEQNQIVKGVMQDPSGPWVVSWYKETDMVGQRGNSVMSGHVDYWGVGPSVFYTVGQLQPGAEIDVTGKDGTVYTYAVEWVKTYTLQELTAETINSIVSPDATTYPALTLITCGGDFDQAKGEYLGRTIIRAKLMSEKGGHGDQLSAEQSQPAAATAGGLQAGGKATVTDDGVNLRSKPSTSGEVVATLSAGTEVTVTGASDDAEGYTWWPIETTDGTKGWIAGDFLKPEK